MPEGVLSNLDLFLIFAYFVVLLIIGWRYSKRQSQEDFLIAERKLGAFSTMMTINASKTGSILMIFVALAYLWGFSAIWYFLGVVAGALLFIPFALRLRERSERYYTLADYFRHNYGRGASYFASLLTIFGMVGFLIVNLIASAKVFSFFTGWSFWLSSLIMVLIILCYLLLSGYKAVVATDILQYFAIMFIMVLLSFLLFNGSLIPFSEWNLFSADIFSILGFFIVGILIPFASPDLWQRVYSARGKKELKKALIWSAIIYGVVAFLLTLIALTVKSNFPLIDPDTALIYGFANLLPAGLVGLSVVLLFSAMMSSIDTYIFTASSAIIQDFFSFSKEKTIKYMKVVIFLLSIFAFLVSILIQDALIGTYIFIAFVMPLSVCVIASWINSRIKQRTILFGFIFGLVFSLGFMIKTLLEGNIEPSIVLVGIVGTIFGLFFGKIYNFIFN